MKIQTHLYASLTKYLPYKALNKSCIIEMPDHSTVRDLIAELNLPIHLVKLIFVNGIHANANAELKDGDRVGIFPAVGGG